MRFATFFACIVVISRVSAQSLVITYEQPPMLSACDTATFKLTVQNAGTSNATNLVLTATMPLGVEYVPGSVVGAIEQLPLNTSAPAFEVSSLAAGVNQSIALRLTANCLAADRLDANQVFPIGLNLSGSTGTAQVTTTPLKVETGLLLIESVTPTFPTGSLGDTVSRRICVRNTRLGRIGLLHLEDSHTEALSIFLPNALAQLDMQNLFSATLDGDFFKQFGNGDAWLDLDETACFTENIVIRDCGEPAFTTPSMLRAGWGCVPDAPCRYDSLLTGIQIIPTTKSPKVKATYRWLPPTDHCNQSPALTYVTFHNTGQAEARNFFVRLQLGTQGLIGLDTGTLQVVLRGVTTPVKAELVLTEQDTNSCGTRYVYGLSANLPNIPPQDSIVLIFNNFYCLEKCQQLLPKSYLGFAYRKPCAQNSVISDSIYIDPDDAYLFEGYVKMDLATCFQPGSTYELTYTLQSQRLLTPNSRVEVRLKFPHGIRWAGQCLPATIGGLVPTVTDMDTAVTLVFTPPFSSDSLTFPFCLRYDCDTMAGGINPYPPEPVRGGGFVFLVGDSCRYARHDYMESEAYWYASQAISTECAISACQQVLLSVNDTCSRKGDIAFGADSIPINGIFKWTFDTYRLNYGLADDNDDRLADPGAGIAMAPGVRRDRYLPGDTMRVAYRGFMEMGSINALLRSIWHEVLRGDMGGDNSVFRTKSAQTWFTNWDSLAFVRQFLQIRYADGTVATCPLPDTASFRSDMHFYSVNYVNTLPPVIVDEMCTQRHVFLLSFEQLFQQGCLPKPRLEAGDSIQILTDFVFNMNFAPQSGNEPNPPLVGFRTSLAHRNARFAWNQYPTRKSQYSGFKTEGSSNIFNLRACSNSTTTRAYRFRLRIARPNLFPYEVRPLAQISHYQQSMPPGVFMQSALLRYLALQDSIPVFSNLPLSFTQQDTLATLDFKPVFNNPVDEGFLISATATFPPNCQFTRPDTSTQFISWTSPHGFYYDTPKRDTTFNRLGFFSSAPILRLESLDTLVSPTTQDFNAVFTLHNDFILQAPNAWFSAVSTSGSVYDLSLQELPAQQSVPLSNGVFQLSSINGFGKKQLRLTGKNRACGTDTLLLIFGWGCGPITSLSQDACGRDTFPILLRLQNPELELTVRQEPPNIPLCEPSEEFEIELYNAKIGSAFDLLGQVKLPQGVRIAPGSSQIAFPAGSAFVPLQDPNALAGNIFQWPVSTLLPALGANGLPGSNQMPQNAVRIRFRLIADCNFAANLPPIYGAESVSACGQASNALNKPGKPLQVPGLGTPYQVQISLNALDGPAVCGGAQRFSVQLTLLGTSNATDSALVLLPPGVGYQAGSYTPLQNAPAGPPTTLANGFRVAIPPGLPAFSVLRFEFSAVYGSEAGCLDQTISVQTRIRGEAFCATAGTSCPVYVASGETSLSIGLQHPNFGLNNAVLNINGNQSAVSLSLSNLGTVPVSGATIQIWQDKDMDGAVGPGDVPIETWTPMFILGPGQNLALQQTLDNIPPLCNLLIQLPAAENCACADKVFPITAYSVKATPIYACAIQPLPLGLTAQPGFSYEWTPPDGLSCLTCSSTTFTPGPSVGPGYTGTFTLLEQSATCSIRHSFELTFSPQVQIQTSAEQLCKGESLTLQAGTGAASYAWSGQGITNPALPTQIITAISSGRYSVVASFPNNCRDTAYIDIIVFKGDTTQLSERATCAGVPVNILGQLSDKAGIYQQKVKNSKGCDSLLLQTLKVLPNPSTRLERLFCEGDTLRLFDTLLTQSGTVCRSFKAANGCDSLHCIEGRSIPGPKLLQPDTLFGTVGQVITLQGPPGFQTYQWTPNVPPCNNCQGLVVTPDTTGLFRYQLRVTDANSCIAISTYLLFVPPSCDPVSIRLPNAFTPNGDDLNDVFRPIVIEAFLTSARLQIYTRWGEKIYDSTGPKVAWDGTVDGKPAPTDVYVYILDVTCSGGKSGKRWGDVTLIR